MPRYELSLIVRAFMERPDLTKVIKKTCTSIIEFDGLVRKIENLGQKDLPYKISANGQRHTKGNYFLLDFELPTKQVSNLRSLLFKDLDIVRPGILAKDEKFVRPCRTQECQFGELPIPDHEIKTWKKRVYKRVTESKGS